MLRCKRPSLVDRPKSDPENAAEILGKICEIFFRIRSTEIPGGLEGAIFAR